MNVIPQLVCLPFVICSIQYVVNDKQTTSEYYKRIEMKNILATLQKPQSRYAYSYVNEYECTYVYC